MFCPVIGAKTNAFWCKLSWFIRFDVLVTCFWTENHFSKSVVSIYVHPFMDPLGENILNAWHYDNWCWGTELYACTSTLFTNSMFHIYSQRVFPQNIKSILKSILTRRTHVKKVSEQ